VSVGPAGHQPIRLSWYRRIHDTVMQKFRADYFVGNDTLEFAKARDNGLALVGAIGCLGRIIISVDKEFKVTHGDDGKPWVQTDTYSYNAYIQGKGTFLRWDNVHAHPGHYDAHHRHEYDWKTGTEHRDSPIWVGADNWPTLGQVISEVANWYWEHRTELEFDLHGDSAMARTS